MLKIDRIGRARVCVALWGLAVTATSSAGAQGRRVELPSGTVVPVRLDKALSSKTSEAGDRFTATVKSGRDDAGLPEGTRVEGVVREAIPAANGKPGVLDMDFRRLVFPNGRGQTLDASLISMDAKSVKRNDSGRLVATADKGKDRLKWVGIGAGAGLLIAAVTKQNTIISTLLGAGAGYLFNEFGNNKKPGDVNIKEGTEFGIRLERQFAFNTNRPPYRASGNERDDIDERDRGDDKYYHRNDAARRDRDEVRDGDREEIGVLFNDKNVRFGSARPLRRNESILVPLDPVARAAGIDYKYDASDKVIRVRNGSVRMGIDSRIVVINGERKRLDAAPELRNNTLYVPMRFLALAVNGSAYWDGPSKTVVVTTNERRE